MSRLTKSIREQVLQNALIKSGYVERNKKLIERRAKLADDVRLFALGGKDKEREILDRFEKIEKYISRNSPECIHVDIHLLGRRQFVSCNFSGRAIDISFCGKVVFSREIFKPLVFSSHRNRIAITRENPLSKEFDFIEKEQKTINDIKTTVKVEVSSILKSVTTIKKLIEIWPESQELIPKEINKTASTQLVANIEKLNTVIGIPTQKEE